jgi:AraC-like DNA-binding protein
MLSESCFRPVQDDLRDVDHLLFKSELVAVGAWRCAPSHPRFEDSGAIRNHCLVFPRSSSWIEHADGRRFLGDQATISLYCAGQEYRRAMVSPEGDFSDYFVVNPGALREALAARDPAMGDVEDGALFRDTHTSCAAPQYARQRQIFRAAAVPAERQDGLEVEVQVLSLLSSVLDAMTPATPVRATPSGHRDIAEATRALLALHYAEPWTLSRLATRIGVSPYHLCRVFRAQTGQSLHQYRNQIRLSAALNRMGDGQDLTAVALDVGYSSHSHFTSAFRRAFGHTPREFTRGVKD